MNMHRTERVPRFYRVFFRKWEEVNWRMAILRQIWASFVSLPSPTFSPILFRRLRTNPSPFFESISIFQIPPLRYLNTIWNSCRLWSLWKGVCSSQGRLEWCLQASEIFPRERGMGCARWDSSSSSSSVFLICHSVPEATLTRAKLISLPPPSLSENIDSLLSHSEEKLAGFRGMQNFSHSQCAFVCSLPNSDLIVELWRNSQSLHNQWIFQIRSQTLLLFMPITYWR